MSLFRKLLFTRVIPNLKRIGLLTDRVRPLFEKLGILDLEDQASDGDIDWALMEQPLELSSVRSHAPAPSQALN